MAEPVRVEIQGLEEVELLLSGVKNAVPKVLTRSINDTLKSVGAKAGQIIRRELNLKVKAAKKGFSTKKATYSTPGGYFIVKNSPYPAIDRGEFNFGFRKLKKGGYSAKVKKSKGRIKLKTAFRFTTGKTDNIAVRTGRGKYAFKLFYSTSPADILSNDAENRELNQHANTKVNERLNHYVGRALKGHG